MLTYQSKSVSNRGFSLVEVTIAIGIFAFVIVGILGLFPTALRLRSESALETRSVMIAQQLFSQVASSPSITNVIIRDGPAMDKDRSRSANLSTDTDVVVLGYQAGSSLPYWYYSDNPGASWTNAGGADAGINESVRNQITTLARLSAFAVAGTTNLYRVTVDVRSPATIPLANAKPVSFSTFVALQ
jgi:prepilin-type N-terminal cleavage/methylation domain-containing protein